MPGNIVVRGDGIAALCCSRLLGQAGLEITSDAPARPKVPALLLSDTTQKLLEDVFDRSDLFDGLTRVTRRIVAWGKDSKPVALPHSAVVTSEQELLNRIREADAPELSVDSAPSGWSIFAAPPLPGDVKERHFGSRSASAAAVKVKTSSPRDACWIESLDDGWLFLLPVAGGAWLLSVGNTVEWLLGTQPIDRRSTSGNGSNERRFCLSSPYRGVTVRAGLAGLRNGSSGLRSAMR